MAINMSSPLWRRIFSRLQRGAVVTVHDEKFQPTEAEMEDIIRKVYDSGMDLRPVRSLLPDFDFADIRSKYAAIIAVYPDLDVTRRKMNEDLSEIPYTLEETGVVAPGFDPQVEALFK